MKLIIDKEEQQDASYIAEEAVLAQAEVERLKLALEIAEAKRDELAEKVRKSGIEVYGGYRFVEKRPSETVSEAKFKELYPEIFSGYCDWARKTADIKVSKTGVGNYLKAVQNQAPKEIMEAITVEGKGKVTYQMSKMKEVSE